MYDIDLSEMSLSELFAEADKVGDKYLSDEEIENREKELDQLREEITLLSLE